MSHYASQQPGTPPEERGNPMGGLTSGATNYAQVPSSPTSPFTPPLPNNGGSDSRNGSPQEWGQSPQLQPSNTVNSTTSGRSNSRYVPSPLNPHASVNPPRTRPSSWGSSRQASDVSDMTDADLSRGVMTHNVGGQFGPYAPVRGTLTPTPSSLGPFSGGGGPGAHQRYSTMSTANSVLSFATDSKYASGIAHGSSFYPLPDNDPRASIFLQSDLHDYNDNTHDDDDELHAPEEKGASRGGWGWRGVINVSTLVILVLAILTLFTAYPVIHQVQSDLYKKSHPSSLKINGTGQVPVLFGMPDLVDKDTPEKAKTRKGVDGHDYTLVFSDEFNKDGRTFYPGDDPYWEAVDLWYWATADLEWYDPGQVTTKGGNLVITMENRPLNGLQYRSGMLQSWNKFCFTTGYIEVSMLLPGTADVSGYWPGIWIMGNLARPGFGASSDGLWPYTYDSCDVGTFPNQTDPNGNPAIAATAGTSAKYNYNLSWLTGQRLSACTCPGEDHPGPVNNKGRGSPEIDVLEAQKNKDGPGGRVTQSAQFAPFDDFYQYVNTSGATTVFDPSKTHQNPYRGSGNQMAISGLTDLDPSWYANGGGKFAVYGFEYWSNPKARDEGTITWITGGVPVYQATAAAVPANPRVQIGPRLISEEPMSIVLNMAISESFQNVDLTAMTFPADLLIDYVRVYQRSDSINVGCDPPDYPTADYINRHLNAYTNRELIDWAGAGYTKPKNGLWSGGC